MGWAAFVCCLFALIGSTASQDNSTETSTSFSVTTESPANCTCDSSYSNDKICCDDNGVYAVKEEFCRYKDTFLGHSCLMRCCKSGTVCGQICAPEETHQCCNSRMSIVCPKSYTCCGPNCCAPGYFCSDPQSGKCCQNGYTLQNGFCVPPNTNVCSWDYGIGCTESTCCGSGSSYDCLLSGTQCCNHAGRYHSCRSYDQCCHDYCIDSDERCCSRGSYCQAKYVCCDPNGRDTGCCMDWAPQCCRGLCWWCGWGACGTCCGCGYEKSGGPSVSKAKFNSVLQCEKGCKAGSAELFLRILKQSVRSTQTEQFQKFSSTKQEPSLKKKSLNNFKKTNTPTFMEVATGNSHTWQFAQVRFGGPAFWAPVTASVTVSEQMSPMHYDCMKTSTNRTIDSVAECLEQVGSCGPSGYQQAYLQRFLTARAQAYANRFDTNGTEWLSCSKDCIANGIFQLYASKDTIECCNKAIDTAFEVIHHDCMIANCSFCSAMENPKNRQNLICLFDVSACDHISPAVLDTKTSQQMFKFLSMCLSL